jgi:hypothetical protein
LGQPISLIFKGQEIQKNGAQLQLTDILFFLGLCPPPDCLKKQGILEAGSVSISPIIMSQEIQKNGTQLKQSSFLGLCPLLGFLKKQDSLEGGFVSIIPIFKSQEFKRTEHN